nr:MAG TPA: hypothetical protein [Caudoviricetes sp.]
MMNLLNPLLDALLYPVYRKKEQKQNHAIASE